MNFDHFCDRYQWERSHTIATVRKANTRNNRFLMGCSCSKSLETNQAVPNPLHHLQTAEAPTSGQQRRRGRREEKRQRQLQKLQKRNARKRRQQKQHSPRSSYNYNNKLAPQMRLRGGSTGSSATECLSALYERTVEQQREEHQRTIELKLRHQLERQLHTFLLNQLLLGIQFFRNFDQELAAIEEQLLAKQRLSEHSLLHASAIDAAVAKQLLFKPIDGTQQRKTEQKEAEPLQKPLTYVVFENVDIARPGDGNYDSIAALCKVILETDYNKTTPCKGQYIQQLLEHSRWMGYVRLKLREPTMKQLQRSSSTDEVELDIYTDGSSGYSTATGSGSATGSAAGSASIYDHVYIARLNTQRSMEELQLKQSNPLTRNQLPEDCICRLSSCLPAWLELSDDEMDSSSSDEEEQQSEEQSEQQSELSRSGYETVQVLRQCRMEQQQRFAQLQQCYLSSEQFMHYFAELLRQQLGQELGISLPELTAGSYRGCSIYTATEELVPAIHVTHGFPDCAFEFNLRSRPGEPSQQWPSPQMRKRIQSFGFHIVPVGYAPKRARNPFRQLEWRIIFPQAEQYLERQLNRMQLKLLLLLKALLRSYINDKCQALGHIIEQLRAHLFWQCERIAGQDWSEEFLGEQLVRFVRSFADCLAKKQLNDYFIARRNLFEHVPEDALMELRSIMGGIAEQPLVHVLQALRNLKHGDDFYPKLNYSKLLENLLAKDYLQLRSWAKFARNPLPALDQQAEHQLDSEPVQEQHSEPVGLLGMRQHQERTRGKLRRKTQLLRAQQQLEKLSEQRRDSSDSLILPRNSQTSQHSVASTASITTPPLNDGVEILRRTNLLELLLDHLLAMLSKATEFHNPQHAQLYLEQGQRLCRLYQQLGCSQYAQHYTDALCLAASNLERMNSAQTSSSTSCSSKSLRFVEHVVQLHTGELLPLRSSTTSVPPAPEELSVVDPSSSFAEEPQSKSEPEPEHEQTSSNSSEKAPQETSFSTLGSLFQRLQIDPGPLQSLSSKTEQIIQNLAPETRREELRDIFKRNTQKLKSAFN